MLDAHINIVVRCKVARTKGRDLSHNNKRAAEIDLTGRSLILAR